MKLNLDHPFTLGDMIRFVKLESPTRIEMSPGQFKHYKNIVNQKVSRVPHTFMRVPIEVYES